MRALGALTFYNVMRVICLNYVSTLCAAIFDFLGQIPVRSLIYRLHTQDVCVTSTTGTEISGNVRPARDARPRYFGCYRRSFTEQKYTTNLFLYYLSLTVSLLYVPEKRYLTKWKVFIIYLFVAETQLLILKHIFFTLKKSLSNET